MKVLFSIHPEHANNILAGTKKFEFRRKIFARNDVKTVVIYATSPVCRIIGEFDIEEILHDEPKKIWNATKKNAGIDSDYFDTYFDGRDKAFALKVKSSRRYKTPIEMKDIFPDSPMAPQSFRYMPKNELMVA